MGLAVVGDIVRGRGRIELNICLLDHKCLGAHHGVIAVRLVDDVDRSGIAGVYVVFVADFIFTYINRRAAVSDCNLGLFRAAVIDIADKRVPILVKQRDVRERHRLRGDGDNH